MFRMSLSASLFTFLFNLGVIYAIYPGLKV
jgi:hypothetical protein